MRAGRLAAGTRDVRLGIGTACIGTAYVVRPVVVGRIGKAVFARGSVRAAAKRTDCGLGAERRTAGTRNVRLSIGTVCI